jgi:hypothetical protein
MRTSPSRTSQLRQSVPLTLFVAVAVAAGLIHPVGGVTVAVALAIPARGILRYTLLAVAAASMLLAVTEMSTGHPQWRL